MSDKAIESQANEFKALAELTTAHRNLPPIVDDDYPEYRHYYERALDAFLKACAANGRELPK